MGGDRLFSSCQGLGFVRQKRRRADIARQVAKVFGAINRLTNGLTSSQRLINSLAACTSRRRDAGGFYCWFFAFLALGCVVAVANILQLLRDACRKPGVFPVCDVGGGQGEVGVASLGLADGTGGGLLKWLFGN